VLALKCLVCSHQGQGWRKKQILGWWEGVVQPSGILREEQETSRDRPCFLPPLSETTGPQGRKGQCDRTLILSHKCTCAHTATEINQPREISEGE
jgi:hypothetical protein